MKPQCGQCLGTKVNIRNPCIPWISSFSAWLTIWCYWTVLFSLNSSDSILISYIAPQPPEMSVTLIAVARGNFSLRIWVTLSSPSVCEANMRWAQWRRGSCHRTDESHCAGPSDLPCKAGPWAKPGALHGIRCPFKFPRMQNKLFLREKVEL